MNDNPDKLYPAVDLSDPLVRVLYNQHVAAMTEESLESKGDIAEQLAIRDLKIGRLTIQAGELPKIRQLLERMEADLTDLGLPQEWLDAIHAARVGTWYEPGELPRPPRLSPLGIVYGQPAYLLRPRKEDAEYECG